MLDESSCLFEDNALRTDFSVFQFARRNPFLLTAALPLAGFAGIDCANAVTLNAITEIVSIAAEAIRFMISSCNRGDPI
jgi:hypothetical protein